MYGDVVVVPAETGQVAGRVGAAPGSLDDVVNLQPVTGAASIDDTSIVPGQYCSSETGPDSPGGPAADDVGFGDGDVLYPALAFDEVHDVGTHPWSGQDGSAFFETRLLGQPLVGYHHQQGLAPVPPRGGRRVGGR